MKSVLKTIHAFHITTKVVSSNTVHGQSVLDTTLCDKVCQWLAEGRILRVIRFHPPIKLTATI